MTFSPEERKDKLDRLLDLLQTSRYIYEKVKGGVSIAQLPPPTGTPINCESAARVFMQIASDMGIDKLEALYYKAADDKGYLVKTTPPYKALGNPPEITGPGFTGWEFDNHWRVRDMKSGIIYDPTFGTSSPHNLIGYTGTSMTVAFPRMTTVYGNKYQVVRSGAAFTCKEISPAPVDPRLQVNDSKFMPKPMTGLRPVAPELAKQT